MENQYLTAILADDEPAITEGLSSLPIWEELGISVIATADSGEKALERILTLKPDFAIMDIMMPGMTGLDVLEKLEKASIDTDIIILSGYGRFDYARKALKFQAKAYLLKPVDTDELRETLLTLKERRTDGQGTEKARISRSTLNDLADGKLLETRSAISLLASGSYGMPDAHSFAMIFSFEPPVREGTLSVIEAATAGEKRIIWNKDQATARAIFTFSGTAPFAIAEKSLKALEERGFPLPIIAIGSVVEKLGQIATSFSRASLALSYRLYDENGRIFTSDTLPLSPPEYKPSDEDAERLVSCILADDSASITVFCSSFIDKLLGSSLPPPNYVYSITNWLIREAEKKLSGLISDTGLIPETPDITRYSSIPRLKEGLSELFIPIASYIAAVYGKEEAEGRIEGEEEQDPIIRKMKEYIDSHTEEQIRLEDISDPINLSPSYAAIYFRKKTGITLREYMLQRKMEDARKMLLSKDAAVTDIAYRLGYHDYRSFSRAFKNISGMTPSEFQEKHQR